MRDVLEFSTRLGGTRTSEKRPFLESMSHLHLWETGGWKGMGLEERRGTYLEGYIKRDTVERVARAQVQNTQSCWKGNWWKDELHHVEVPARHFVCD